MQQEADITHRKSLNDLELNKARELSSIESYKFKALVQSIGRETIQSIAQAGPEMQAKLLHGLGLKSFMITDGKSPINLFGTAGGLIAPAHLGHQ